MNDSPMTEEHKRALIVAFYLSKFDRKAVRALGYKTFDEAFSYTGIALGVKSSTIKHMRDSFDPYCSQVRVGWYQRMILPSRANVIAAYDALSEEAMTAIVQQLLLPKTAQTESLTAVVGQYEGPALLAEDTPFAARTKTGDAAEAFFITQFPTMPKFVGSQLEDTRRIGIGFDFRVSFPKMFYAVEVKGLIEYSGYISFTDKEWSVAKMLGDDYLLALVRGLQQSPQLEMIANPTAQLSATMRTAQSITVSWATKL